MFSKLSSSSNFLIWVSASPWPCVSSQIAHSRCQPIMATICLFVSLFFFFFARMHYAQFLKQMYESSQHVQSIPALTLPTQRLMTDGISPLDASFPKPILWSPDWLANYWFVTSLGHFPPTTWNWHPYAKGRKGPTKEIKHSRLVGSSLNERGNLSRRLVLSNCNRNSFLHPPVKS